MYRPKRRGRLFLLVFLALSILIITLDFRGGSGGPLERAKEVTEAIVRPIQRGITAITRPVGNFFSAIGDLADLRDENSRLQNEVDQLRSEVNEARELSSENAELRDHLALEESWAQMDRITAQVIADSPGNYQWAVVIDRGSEDGIAKDMGVITPQGLAGKIIEVDPHESIVLLLVDSSIGVGITTDERRLTGIVVGRGEGQDLSMQFVSKEESVSVGDRVVTSNRNDLTFPPGIPIGVVSEVGGDQRASQLDIDVDPFVDFGRLNFLQVLLGTGDGAQVGDNE